MDVKKRGKRNKRAGNNFELEVIHKLKEIGFIDCVSSRSKDKLADANKIDVVSETLPCNIQCKYTQATPNYFEIRKGCNDNSKPFCIIWKKAAKDGRKSPGILSIIPFEYFLDLLKNNSSDGEVPTKSAEDNINKNDIN